jgi:hypothetical protein
MNWLAMQPEDAMGIRGQQLASRYKVKGIPSLVLLDEVGNVITLDARNKIPTDKAGIGFPWRNPIAQAYVNLVPKPPPPTTNTRWRGGITYHTNLMYCILNVATISIH